MTHCAKCGAELIGSKKFCATCGAPAVDPRAVTAPDSSGAALPSSRYAASVAVTPPTSSSGDTGPRSVVNPLGETALPKSVRAPSYGPPPPTQDAASSGAQPESSYVSPLAKSKLVATDAPRRPGTQLMPTAPRPPAAPNSGGPARTQAISGVPPLPPPTPTPAEPLSGSQGYAPPPPAPAPPYGAPHGGHRPPPGRMQPPSYAPPYAPGMRVQVTWSNGLRYSAVIQQLRGSQCLVHFPDGQQHWVDLQYVSPLAL